MTLPRWPDSISMVMYEKFVAIKQPIGGGHLPRPGRKPKGFPGGRNERLIAKIAKSLVDHPEAVEVNEIEGARAWSWKYARIRMIGKGDRAEGRRRKQSDCYWERLE